METMKLILPFNEEMTAIRRYIHQHPELSNEEFETTKLIREKLTEYGIEIAEIGLKTGSAVLYPILIAIPDVKQTALANS